MIMPILQTRKLRPWEGKWLAELDTEADSKARGLHQCHVTASPVRKPGNKGKVLSAFQCCVEELQGETDTTQSVVGKQWQEVTSSALGRASSRFLPPCSWWGWCGNSIAFPGLHLLPCVQTGRGVCKDCAGAPGSFAGLKWWEEGFVQREGWGSCL